MYLQLALQVLLVNRVEAEQLDLSTAQQTLRHASLRLDLVARCDIDGRPCLGRS